MEKETRKSVRFNENITIICEPEHLQEDLKLARNSDFFHRQLDFQRLMRLISPVLTNEHRKKIYEKLYQKNVDV